VQETENRWRISLTSTLSRGYWRDLGLPRPSNWLYRDYSQALPQSVGGQTKQGYINLNLIWDRLSRSQLTLLQGFITGAGSGLIYLTVDKANGESGGFDWIDISGYPGIVQYANMPLGRGNVKTGVQLVINNIIIVADPASF